MTASNASMLTSKVSFITSSSLRSVPGMVTLIFASDCLWDNIGGAQGCLESGPCGAGIEAPMLVRELSVSRPG